MKLFKLFCHKSFVDTVKTKVDQNRNIGRAESKNMQSTVETKVQHTQCQQ